jgi:hypothetical protein
MDARVKPEHDISRTNFLTPGTSMPGSFEVKDIACEPWNATGP